MEQADIRTYFSKVDSEQRYICVKTKQPVMKQKSIDLYFKTNENAESIDDQESKDNQENKDNEAQPDENTSRVKKCYGYNPETKCWHCGECGANMGEDNPRQVCGKYACLGYGY
jgi:hypothetical protein